MYPILILRSEFICLVILIFLYFVARNYNITNESTSFRRILTFAIAHVIFDMITVLTVNNINTVPTWLNWICHVIFYLTAIFFSNEIVNYVIKICYKKYEKKLYAIGHIVTLIYILLLPLLKINYVPSIGTYSSSGPAAIVGYGIAFSFFIFALIVIFTHLKKMSNPIKSSLIPMMIVLMLTEIFQIYNRSVLFTGGAITIVTVGFFFSLENPVEVFRKKAMIDALTQVKSRSSYEEEIGKLDKKFTENPSNEYTFVFCDLNDLRNVNNQFGHDEGDNYITLIAKAIKDCMKNSSSIYRIGGDEFLVYYHNVDENIIDSEISNLKKTCIEESKKLKYTAQVSCGYARSSDKYKSLFDVIKTADFAMYQNKSLSKQKANNTSGYGTSINYIGLTDKLFDAMCASNEKEYPFITNMDTNVTRISPEWKDYFGLDSEFYFDFLDMWSKRIHPDYLEGYMKDVIATINGHQKYHNFEYLAKKKDGEYVNITCHGSVYLDNSSGITYFTGLIVNHGLDDNIDHVSGLKNFDVLISDVAKTIQDEKPFAILKLKLINYARVNMLYGYTIGDEVIKNIAKTLEEKVDTKGKVYCQGSVNFTILFNETNKLLIEDFYRDISNTFINGFKSTSGNIPVLISGGAYINIGKHIEIETIRSGLMFAVEESTYTKRNRLVFYEENDNRTDKDIYLLSEVHTNSLSDMSSFYLKYQPIIDLNTSKPIGTEALIRFKNDTYNEITPDKFINFLENDPCYYRVGLWILEQAIKDTKTIQNYITDFKVNVNITSLQLQNESFVSDVLYIIDQYKFKASNLVLEMTERCKEMDTKFLSSKIAELRSKCIKVAFDDLGTGYSTISLLMDIPIDEIKLDGNFVNGLKGNEKYQLFAKALALGSTTTSNHYKICFEGVETKETLEYVKEFGNFYVQGYYFCKPLVIDDLIKYIQ